MQQQVNALNKYDGNEHTENPIQLTYSFNNFNILCRMKDKHTTSYKNAFLETISKLLMYILASVQMYMR